MPSRPWYRWNPGDYLRDTYSLSWDADLLYRRILDALWERGTLPTDLGDLSKICRIDPRKMRRIFPEVLPYLRETSGRYDHPRMSRERAEVTEKSRKARRAGQKGGLAKALATRARAREVPTRGREEIRDQKDLNRNRKDISEVGRSTTRGNGEMPAVDWTPEQQAERERLQADLEQRRRERGVDTSGPRPAAVTALAALTGSAVGSEKDGKDG